MRRTVLVAVALVSSSLSAQLTDTASIPRDLALSLLSPYAFGPNRGAIVVGKPAAALNAKWIPAKVALLGSYGPSTTFMVPASPDSAVQVFRMHVLSAGWSDVPATPVGRGFSGSSLVAMMPGGRASGATFCREADAMMVMAAERDAGGAFVSVTIAPGRRTQCDKEFWASMTGGRYERRLPIDLPALEPPKGARGATHGTSSSDRSVEMQATYESVLNARELAEHFGKQMDAAGWKRASSGGDGDVAVIRWTRTPQGREKEFAYIADIRFEPGKHSLVLSAYRGEVTP